MHSQRWQTLKNAKKRAGRAGCHQYGHLNCAFGPGIKMIKFDSVGCERGRLPAVPNHIAGETRWSVALHLEHEHDDQDGTQAALARERRGMGGAPNHLHHDGTRLTRRVLTHL